MDILIFINESLIAAAFLIATVYFARRAALQVSYADTRQKKLRTI